MCPLGVTDVRVNPPVVAPDLPVSIAPGRRSPNVITVTDEKQARPALTGSAYVSYPPPHPGAVEFVHEDYEDAGANIPTLAVTVEFLGYDARPGARSPAAVPISDRGVAGGDLLRGWEDDHAARHRPGARGAVMACGQKLKSPPPIAVEVGDGLPARPGFRSQGRSAEGVAERPLDSVRPGDSVSCGGFPLPLPPTARCGLDANPSLGRLLSSKVQFEPGSRYRTRRPQLAKRLGKRLFLAGHFRDPPRYGFLSPIDA